MTGERLVCKKCTGSFIVLLIVILIGSAIFSSLERPGEVIRQERGQAFIDRMQSLLAAGAMNQSDYNIINQLVTKQADTIQNPQTTNWNFAGSFYFVVTIVTTIGYGSFAPETSAGKTMVVVFGVVGLAIAAYCMGNFTEIIGLMFNRLLKKCFKDDAQASRRKAGVMAAMGVVLWVVFAICMSVTEGWDFGIGMYFAFVTLSTIGFGDYALAVGRPAGMAIWFISVIFGIGMLGLAIGFIGELFAAKATKLREHYSHSHHHPHGGSKEKKGVDPEQQPLASVEVTAREKQLPPLLSTPTPVGTA